jgi:hypothetical protein
LRTRLNFAASGCNDPPCFSDSFDKSMLSGLIPQTAIQVAELEGIMRFARRKRLSYPWLNALRRRIWLSRIAIPIKTAIRWGEVRPWLRAKRNGLRRRGADSPAESHL